MEQTDDCDHSPINSNREDNADKGNLDDENVEELKKKITDLELQLEYEINRHEDEIRERDDALRQMEEKLIEMENAKSEMEEKDKAILNLSEKLLIISNKYDVLVKEGKLKDEEIKHIKNKKKYKKQATDEYIATMKKQNDEFKNDNDAIHEKYDNLLKEYDTLTRDYKLLEEELNKNIDELNLEKTTKMNEYDEIVALKMLHMDKELRQKRHAGKDLEEENSLKLELKYKDMIIKKLIIKNEKEKILEKKEFGNKEDNNNNIDEQINNYEKKVNELYQKCIDSQTEQAQLQNKITKYCGIIDDLKKENNELLETITTLREYINTTQKEDTDIHQYDDLINNLLKENVTLNEEISKQKKKNIADVYYYNKELQMLQNDKMKIIEKFDIANKSVPHLYEPLNVTLHEQKDDEKKTNFYKNNNGTNIQELPNNLKKDTNLIKGNSDTPKDSVVTEDFAHIYMQDYMKNVQNRKE
ncbi:conserved Plasmodium protein, unknown function [Plasmodium chabaudi chabaudi]|uniref:Uncharacterized protein n=1 Tax=Plasmodium chabaudi chabaudi TaxID=31271 RepID=A0A1D3LF43_PLACU|nr:conserved Plasmodium protein, unknown function [Plasmodium chabaudi chabaudi]